MCVSLRNAVHFFRVNAHQRCPIFQKSSHLYRSCFKRRYIMPGLHNEPLFTSGHLMHYLPCIQSRLPGSAISKYGYQTYCLVYMHPTSCNPILVQNNVNFLFSVTMKNTELNTTKIFISSPAQSKNAMDHQHAERLQ